MASPFADAITASLVSSMDPMQSVVPQFAQSLIAAKQEEVQNTRISTMERLTTLITQANESKAPPSVIAAYEKMLASYTK